jgi:ATP-dependent 26S proteasome regulatory subunit
MNREENRFGGAIANILNMSDGLMSDIFNVKFLCTFNTDIDNIDDALLRPGRCYNKYEFKELCEEKTAKLLNKQGHTPKVVKPMTLANIYNYNPETEVETKKKIGF